MDVPTKFNNPGLFAQTIHKLIKMCDSLEAWNMITRDSDSFCVK